jgi:acyl carrier protein
MGLTALSVNWGTWGEVGMAVDGAGQTKSGMLAGMGTIGTTPGLSALQRLIGANSTSAAVMPINWPELLQSYPSFATDPFLSSLSALAEVSAHTRTSSVTAATVRAMSGTEQTELLITYLQNEAARALGMSPEALDAAQPLSSLGFDSLMAVQLKNQIENDLGLVVPMVQFLQGPSVASLAPVIQAGFVAGASAGSPAPSESEGWEAGTL